MSGNKNYSISRKKKLFTIAVLSAINALIFVFLDCLNGCTKFTNEIKAITFLMLILILILLWSAVKDKNLEQQSQTL